MFGRTSALKPQVHQSLGTPMHLSLGALRMHQSLGEHNVLKPRYTQDIPEFGILESSALLRRTDVWVH